MKKIAVALIVILGGCSKQEEENKCISYIQAHVVKVEGNKTGVINQEMELSVYFGCFNGCGSFEKTESTLIGDTTFVKVIAVYSGCICTQDAPIRTGIFKYKSSKKGTHYLKFIKTGGSYLSDTLYIQ